MKGVMRRSRTAAVFLGCGIIGAASAGGGGWGWSHHYHHPAPRPTVTATPTRTVTPPATGTVPLPAALRAGHPLVASFSPQVLTSPAWANPANHPGNCPTVTSHAVVNAAGAAQITTTGATGDCRSIQSPGTLPTRPGYVYEALVNFSSFHDWPAFWAYGPDWPQQGEIDAVEGGPGESFVTWHQAGNFTIGPDPWDNQVVPHAGGPNIAPGTWTTVDISFTGTGVDVYYNGALYVHIPENVTTGGSDPMFFTVSEGSCDANGVNVCNGGTSPPGTVQVKYLREFS